MTVSSGFSVTGDLADVAQDLDANGASLDVSLTLKCAGTMRCVSCAASLLEASLLKVSGTVIAEKLQSKNGSAPVIISQRLFDHTGGSTDAVASVSRGSSDSCWRDRVFRRRRASDLRALLLLSSERPSPGLLLYSSNL